MNPNITKVWLMNVPFENDYKNTIAFSSIELQESYFATKRISDLIFTDFSYQRKDNTIRIPLHIDTIQSRVNYVMYENSYYTNKKFYAFITNMRYINDCVTELTIETDVLQTWMFDYNIQESFIEREHTSNDSIGANTIPENLETGEYVVKRYQDSTIFDNVRPVISVTDESVLLGTAPSQLYLDPIPRGYTYVMLGNNQDVDTYIKYIDSLGKGSTIVSIFLAPEDLFDGTYTSSEQVTIGGSTYTISHYNRVSRPKSQATIERYTGITSTLSGNYQPDNNKLLCFPYRYLQVSNNSGATINLKFEDFNVPSDTSQQFNIYGTLTPSCSYKLTPANYKNVGGSDVDYGLTLGKLPIGAWSNDIYTNWLTQNALNLSNARGEEQWKMQMNDTGTAMNVIGSLFGAFGTGNAVSAITSGVGNLTNAYYQNLQNYGSSLYAIKNIDASKYEHSLTPPQASGNLNCGDVNFQYGFSDPRYKEITIKPEYARIIDDYFNMFGYATNLVKRPNEFHRQKWWYTKTINANITGAIPQDDIAKIRSAYDNGITFWTHEDYMFDYSEPNPIV